MKRRLMAFVLAIALVGGFVGNATSAAAAPRQVGGAAGLVAAVLQVALNDTVDIRVVDSFNDIRILNNVLNNSPILSNNDVDITIGDVTLLSNFLNNNNITLTDFLNDLNITIDDVVAIGLLDTGDIIVFV